MFEQSLSAGSADDKEDGDKNKSNPRSFITSRENWLKGNLALLCTKNGLKEFVEAEINAMHNDILEDLYKNVRTGTTCGQCTTANITRCSKRGTCGRNCRIHNEVDPGKRYRPCPNKVCNEFMEQIILCHRYGPTWQNTDATKWFSNPWEVAKCFLPHGCSSSSSGMEADLPELLNIIINNCRFEEKLAEDMKNDKNIYCQARTVRNEAFHSSSGELSKDRLHEMIDLLISLLSDSQCLVNNPAAMEGVHRLIKIRDEPLVISREEAQKIKQKANLQYKADKRRLQHHLAEQYLAQCSRVKLSHMVSELASDFDDLCAPQAIKSVHLPHETEHERREQRLVDVQSYKNVFIRNSQTCRNIYVKGVAGTGKSFFCQRMVLAWSKHIKGQFLKEEEDYIKKFKFLFYIPLKYVPSENDLNEMIFKHPFLNCKDHTILIQQLLQDESEQCLIVLDGLDEWAPKQNTATMFTSKGLPHRDVTRRCTILTTTRPWKLDAVRMKPEEIDQLIEVIGLDDQVAEQYIESLTKCLNERFGSEKNAKDFVSLLHDNDLDTYMCIPVILKSLVCLWHANKPIGNSLCEIYSGMLDFLLQLPEKESAHRSEVLESVKEASPSDKLPPCFNQYPNCRWFGQMLISLSKLSFHSLFDETRESSLVFDSTVTDKHGMSPCEIKACLNAGILSQDIVMQQAALPENKLSFLHKTFQEFLAAVYICLFHDAADNIIQKVREICSSVEIVLEMQKVFVFLSGICPSAVSQLSDHIAGVVTGHGDVQTHRNLLFEDCFEFPFLAYICLDVQNMVLDCMKEAQGTGVSQFLNIYTQDIAVNNREHVPKNMDQLIQCSTENIKSLFIDCPEYLHFLQHVTRAVQIEKLVLYGYVETPMTMSRLSSIIHQNHKSLKCLYLYCITCTDMSVQTLTELFGDLSQLEAIGLSFATLSHEQYVWLVSTLSSRTKLKQICLLQLECTQCDAGHGTLDLTAHFQLNKLRLSEIRRTHIQLPTHFPELKTLELSKLHGNYIVLPTHCPQLIALTLSELHVDQILLPSDCSQINKLELSQLHADLIQLPTHCPKLETLQLSSLHTDYMKLPCGIPQIHECELSYIHTPGVMVSVLNLLQHDLQTLTVTPSRKERHEVTAAVLKTLPELHQIRRISLSYISLKNFTLSLSPLMTQLEEVALHDVTMCRESVCSLVNSVLQIQHLVKVRLWDITIAPEEDADLVLDIVRSSDKCMVTYDVKCSYSPDKINYSLDFHTSVQTEHNK